VDERTVEGARAAIARHGWLGATLARIAAAAGSTRMTLHRHGVTRDELLGELGRRLADEYRAAFEPCLAGPGSARVRLKAALAAECGVAERNLALLDALAGRERAAVFHERGGSRRTRDAFVEPLAQLLRVGAADGSLRAVDDPGEVATVLFNLVGITYRHLRSGHGWSRARARRGVLAVALEGVAS
jgi:AcrR family transcriptional regulator